MTGSATRRSSSARRARRGSRLRLRGRRGARRVRRRPRRRRPLGRLRRRARTGPGARHDRQPLLGRQGGQRDLRAAPRRRRRSTSTRRSPATGPSSPGGEGTGPGALSPHAPGAGSRDRARRCAPRRWSDWDAMTEALAAQAPWWEPGAGHGYHVNTQGFLIGEIVRRVTGQTHRRPTSATSIARTRRHRLLRRLRPGARRALRRRSSRRRRAPRATRAAPARRRAPRRSSGLDAHAHQRLLQSAGDLRDGHRQHPRVARRRGAVDQRPRQRAGGRAPLLRAGRRRRGWTACTCSRRRRSTRRPRSRCTARTSCCSARRASGSASSSPWPSAGSARARAPSATSAPAARSGFADPDARVAFGYAMNQGRGGWQHKHVRHFIDLVYAAL